MNHQIPAHWLIPGPGWGAADDHARLTAGYETGFHDEHGNAAPWPEDFLDPDSGWRPVTADPTTFNPTESPF